MRPYRSLFLFLLAISITLPAFVFSALADTPVSTQTNIPPPPQATPKVESIASPTTSASPQASPSKTTPDMGVIAATVGRLLEQGHFLRLPLNDKAPPHDEATPPLTLPARVMKNYLQILDYSHLYFTQVDVDEFEKKYEPSFTTDILRGDLTAPRAIYARFRQRVEERVQKNKILAAQKHDFSSNKTVELNRQKSAWPRDETEADELWKNRIEAELLQEHLNKHPIDPPAKIITHRYDQILKTLHEQTDEDVIKFFLTSLAESYDPHSEYMSPSDMENFNIQMKLSLVGIGAVLRSDDGYTKVVEIMSGGPADQDGRLQANDRITAVAQGDEAFEDVIDLRIDKVVAKIRGKKGTKVRLQVIPARATDPSKHIVIELTRDEIKLKESAAKAEVIEVPNNKIISNFASADPGERASERRSHNELNVHESSNTGVIKSSVTEGEVANKSEKFGWLTIPSFYSEMDKHGQPDAKSTTKDVELLLTRLKKENISGLIIDLRRNGGGSLDEAINLTGLFIGPGPVVQAKDSTGKISVFNDSKTVPFYDGPIVVLCNRLSASASEIFAAALQDYHRAVIVGDEQSFGKGTVQTLLDVGKFMPLFQGSSQAGTIKLTIQKFYRVSGGSTQHRGVRSDIVLPSTTDTPEISEAMLPNPLVYDEVDPQSFHQFPTINLFLDQLKERSAERVAKNLEFRYIQENMKWITEKLAKNQLSLNEQARKQELADEKKRGAQHKAERSVIPTVALTEYEVTLDTLDNPILEKVTPKKKKEVTSKIKKPKSSTIDDEEEETDDSDTDPNLVDPEKLEAIEIVKDLKNLQQTNHVANTSTQ
ncbi:MAG: carboxy terminal-processing peptidase [Chthoniobacterales bacterium]